LLLSFIDPPSHKNKVDMAINPEDNPLLAQWTGPYSGVPPFDEVKVEYFKPAFSIAMQENLAEIEQIAGNTVPPTFENTIAALERSGRTLKRIRSIYGIWSGTMSSPEFQSIERQMSPLLAAFSDTIAQNEKLFKRIKTVYTSSDKSGLTPEQKRLTWLYYTDFVRKGANLKAEAKPRLSEINKQLAELYTSFNQNLLAEENDQFIILKNESDLAGLPQPLIDAASEEAKSRKQPASWVITNTRSSIEPFLTYSDRRDLRKKAWKMFVKRGDNGDEHDNNAIISGILQLRDERSRMLGYTSFAHWKLQNTMAKTPDRAMELMMAVWKPAVARVHEEVADMQSLARKEKADIKIEPWDYYYYAEKVRKLKYDVDVNEVKKYLQLEKLREGMFWVAGEIFGFDFIPAMNIPVYHPDVRVWEVKDKNTGKHIGLWYFDPYARKGKRSGAWMNAYRNQERMDSSITTIVSNNSNFIKGKLGEPVLISLDDARTLFHEFGHSIQGLASNVTYPSLSGTQVFRDYVEFPSQVMENWLLTPEVLQRFALHYQTGKPIPADLADRIKKTSTFNQGFIKTEQLASAIVDMKIHLAAGQKIDPVVFEKKTLRELNMPDELVMRHRLPQFSHLFSSDSYAAGYYSYIWSLVLASDAYSAFTEAGGPYDKTVAEKMKKHILSVGNTVDPAEAYRNFRGRDPDINALMKDLGFPQ
jgi:peptidyl-dipeptidase Dcp